MQRKHLILYHKGTEKYSVVWTDSRKSCFINRNSSYFLLYQLWVKYYPQKIIKNIIFHIFFTIYIVNNFILFCLCHQFETMKGYLVIDLLFWLIIVYTGINLFGDGIISKECRLEMYSLSGELMGGTMNVICSGSDKTISIHWTPKEWPIYSNQRMGQENYMQSFNLVTL